MTRIAANFAWSWIWNFPSWSSNNKGKKTYI